MPMEQPEHHGTTAAGTSSPDYCVYCFRDGHFTDPNMTKEQMIARATSFLASHRGMPQHTAEMLARRTIGILKRWLNGAA